MPRFSIALVAIFSLFSSSLPVSPAHAGGRGTALGVIGGLAIGAIIANEASKAQRHSERSARHTPRSAKPKTETSAGGEFAEKKQATPASTHGNDPFAGTAGSPPATTEAKSAP